MPQDDQSLYQEWAKADNEVQMRTKFWELAERTYGPDHSITKERKRKLEEATQGLDEIVRKL